MGHIALAELMRITSKGKMKESAKMTKTTHPNIEDEICLFEQENKKKERKKRSKKRDKTKLGKVPPERHRLHDDPEFLQMAALSKMYRVY